MLPAGSITLGSAAWDWWDWNTAPEQTAARVSVDFLNVAMGSERNLKTGIEPPYQDRIYDTATAPESFQIAGWDAPQVRPGERGPRHAIFDL
ncbi:hypothetical protein HAHE_07210 [Haloferula helveola]|uniref:Uncharacterized protein n=1 Tax=Haloferula helveola TaxID=490095 RepID=A0ABM7RGC7_9BACT|nr:hypothetical protein HAHE_07210 [Haloferula helveola]